MKIVWAVEDSNILLKGVTKTIKNKTKEQKGGFLSTLLGTLGVSLLGNLLAGKRIVRTGSENKKGKRTARANNSVMCGYFCIGFIDFMLAGKKIDWFY